MLDELMSSGHQMKTLIEETLSSIVVPYILQDDLRNIPSFLLQGIIKIVKRHESSGIFQ